MPEYKSPTMMMMAAGEGAEGAAGVQGARRSGGQQQKVRVAPPKPPYTGPKWLEHVPGHSPSVVAVGLHGVALALSIIPALAGVGPFWSFVMMVGIGLVVTRELHVAGERPPLFDVLPKMLQSPAVTAVYTGLSVGLCLPMLEISVQPLLWLGGTALLVRDQWGKVFTGPRGYLRLFDPHSLVRSQRIMALVGVTLCMMALFFPWVAPTVPRGNTSTSSRSSELLRVFDSVYSDVDELHTLGIDRPVASTVALGLLALLVLSMLRPEVDRPEWLRFVPIGFSVIALAWVLVNMKMRMGPIMFLAGLVPVGLIAVMTALGRYELGHGEDYPPDEPPTEDAGNLPRGDDQL
jgi:hypothetical protein